MDPDLEKQDNFIIKPKKNKKFNKKHITTIGTIFSIIILIIIFIKPTITGFGVSKLFDEKNIDVADFIEEQELTKANLETTQTTLDACKKLNKDYLEEISKQKTINFQCEEEKNKIQSEFNQLESEREFDKSRIEAEFEQKKNEIEIEKQQYETKYNDIKTLHDAIIENAAYNICCKAKVDNKNIDSYLISNSKIVCTTGGENKITCS